MSLYITQHGIRPRETGGANVDALAAQIGDTSVLVSGGQYIAPASGLYRIVTDAAHTVRLSGAAPAGGEYWPVGKEVRWLTAGDTVRVL